MNTATENKTISIIVNGRVKTVPKHDVMTFEDIVKLAFDPPPTGQNVVITVTYHNGHGEKPEGSLRPGETVKVKDGMVFDVTATNLS
jgi:hypothetical protein